MTATARFALAGPTACACALAGAAAVVALADPSHTSLTPPCPWHTITGWWCPGCGLTRATHHLLRGHVVEAMRYNALVVPVSLAIVVSLFTWWRGTQLRVPAWTYWLAAIIAASFTIVRNLPGIPLRG